jgi:hypothetical protein
MKTMLYNGKYLPVTRTVGFVKDNIDEYVKYLCADNPVNFVADKFTGTLNHGLERFVPIFGPFNGQYLITQTQSEWLAVFSNNGDMMLRLKAKPDSVVLGFTEDSYDFKTNKGEYGYSIFALSQSNTTTRSIVVCNGPDRIWSFEQFGDILDFEKPEYYNSRSKKKRLPFELLEEYGKHFGIRFYDESFYGSEMRYLRSDHHDHETRTIDKDSYELQHNRFGHLIHTYNSYHKEHGLQLGR